MNRARTRRPAKARRSARRSARLCAPTAVVHPWYIVIQEALPDATGKVLCIWDSLVAGVADLQPRLRVISGFSTVQLVWSCPSSGPDGWSVAPPSMRCRLTRACRGVGWTFGWRSARSSQPARRRRVDLGREPCPARAARLAHRRSARRRRGAGPANRSRLPTARTAVLPRPPRLHTVHPLLARENRPGRPRPTHQRPGSRQENGNEWME